MFPGVHGSWGRFWWIWMDENKMPESIWRQCRDPGDRGVECHSHPEGIDWLLGWALASSIFRSLGAGHWQYEHTARAEYRCALDQRSPNRGSGHTSQSQTHTRRHFLGHSSRESVESRFIVGERVDSEYICIKQKKAKATVFGHSLLRCFRDAFTRLDVLRIQQYL